MPQGCKDKKETRMSTSKETDEKEKQTKEKEEGDVDNRLTDSDCSHHWGHNSRESHSTSNHQVPLVVGNIFAFIAVMDLTGERKTRIHTVQTGERAALNASVLLITTPLFQFRLEVHFSRIQDVGATSR